LVPGWSDRADRLHWLRDQLVTHGWSAGQIALVDFRDRFGNNREHSAEIGSVIGELVRRTGSGRIDVIAHSMGGLALRHFLKSTNGSSVRRVVFTGTPHAGTWAAYLALGGGARDMRPGSDFLRELARYPLLPPGVEALCIHTPTDTRILPQRSALLSGVRGRRVWCLSHAQLLRSRRVFAAIRTFLEE
jgi:triacylglycerol esterase/lipase EstA (alpha/beta hydrolase family)